MNLSFVLGLDPTGSEAAVLCVVACLALLSVILAGFALFWQARHRREPTARASEHDWHEPGLLTLWRLQRSLRQHRVRP